MPKIDAIDDIQRLTRAAELKRQHPEWSIRRISKEAGGLCNMRCRDHLVDLGLLRPRVQHDGMIAPDWYDRPPGRLTTQRQAEGIKL